MSRFSMIFNMIFLLVIITGKNQFGQEILINEIMSDNDITIEDGFGEFPDWIEIYNPNDSIVNVGKYYLSDDFENLKKWNIPDYYLGPGEFLLIFASDKDTVLYPKFWNTVISWGDEWSYFLGESEPPTNWNELGFSDSTWVNGITGIGYGDGDDSTLIDTVRSIYCRNSFYLDETESIIQGILDIDVDDGFVAYLNGIEIARNNVDGFPPAHNQNAGTWLEAQIYNGGKPARYELTSEAMNLLQRGKNVLAVQVHNHGSTSSDMSFIPFFSIATSSDTVDRRVVPLLELRSNNRQFHSNFKISSDGEVIFLSDSTGNLVHSVNGVELKGDQSYGRDLDGLSVWKTFDHPTPGTTNNHSNALFFSHERGFYNSPFFLKINSERNMSVYYTLDGSDPTENSLIFPDSLLIDIRHSIPNGISLIPTTISFPDDEPREWTPPDDNITKATVIKCRSYYEGAPTSPVYTYTYFVDSLSTSLYSLPVFSLAMDSLDLFDHYKGIYVPGAHQNPDNNRSGNFEGRGIEWERPVHIEYFDSDGILAFHQHGGIRIHGGYSRRFSQKSLRLYARSEYGRKYFNYPLLPQKETTKYKRFILRSSMSTVATTFGDAFATNLLRDLDFEVQDYQPVIVFINGEYWGVHNIRDYIDEHYLVSLYPELNKDSINILEYGGSIKVGTNQEYLDLLEFVRNNDVSVDENYTVIKNQIEISNYIDYHVSELYLANWDWPGNNMIFWKPNTKNSKWRWILYDLDAALYQYDRNMFEQSTDSTQTSWPNPEWSTFLFRNLIRNEEFRKSLICRIVELMESHFHPDTIIRSVNEFKQAYVPEMNEHVSRWNYPPTVDSWIYDYQTSIPRFAVNRPTHFFANMTEAFNISMNEIREMCNCTCLFDELDIEYIEPFPSEISIYPNPNQGSFTIALPSNRIGEGLISIVDINGRLIYNSIISPQMVNHQIHLDNSSKGLHVVIFVNNNKRYIKKVLIR